MDRHNTSIVPGAIDEDDSDEDEDVLNVTRIADQVFFPMPQTTTHTSSALNPLLQSSNQKVLIPRPKPYWIPLEERGSDWVSMSGTFTYTVPEWARPPPVHGSHHSSFSSLSSSSTHILPEAFPKPRGRLSSRKFASLSGTNKNEYNVGDELENRGWDHLEIVDFMV